MGLFFEMEEALVAEGFHFRQTELEGFWQKISREAGERGCGCSAEEDGCQSEVNFVEEVGGCERAQEGSPAFADEGLHPILLPQHRKGGGEGNGCRFVKVQVAERGEGGAELLRHARGAKDDDRRAGVLEDFPCGIDFPGVADDNAQGLGRAAVLDARPVGQANA